MSCVTRVTRCWWLCSQVDAEGAGTLHVPHALADMGHGLLRIHLRLLLPREVKCIFVCLNGQRPLCVDMKHLTAILNCQQESSVCFLQVQAGGTARVRGHGGPAGTGHSIHGKHKQLWSICWILLNIFDSLFVFLLLPRWSVQVCVSWQWEGYSMWWEWFSLRVTASCPSPTPSGIFLLRSGPAFIIMPSGGTCIYRDHSCRRPGDWKLMLLHHCDLSWHHRWVDFTFRPESG